MHPPPKWLKDPAVDSRCEYAGGQCEPPHIPECPTECCLVDPKQQLLRSVQRRSSSLHTGIRIAGLGFWSSLRVSLAPWECWSATEPRDPESNPQRESQTAPEQHTVHAAVDEPQLRWVRRLKKGNAGERSSRGKGAGPNGRLRRASELACSGGAAAANL